MQAMPLRRSKTTRPSSKTMHRNSLLMMRHHQRRLLRPRNAKRPLRLPRLWTILTTIFHSKKFRVLNNHSGSLKSRMALIVQKESRRYCFECLRLLLPRPILISGCLNPAR